MTKKDYELIAEIILFTKSECGNYQGSAQGVLNLLRDNLGNALERENKKFDIQKFFKACNYKGEGDY